MSATTIATVYANWLAHTIAAAIEDGHAAAYRARLAEAAPIPVTVVRHKCPHCGTTRAKQAAAAAHVARCWHNPDVRACKTCVHFDPGAPAGGCWGDPYCNCPEVPEGCEVGAWPDGVAFPVIDCPSWETAR